MHVSRLKRFHLDGEAVEERLKALVDFKDLRQYR